jgi:hypothetical protein
MVLVVAPNSFESVDDRYSVLFEFGHRADS